MRFIDTLPLYSLVLICLTLGLAPFVPEPHVWEKLKMLVAGDLTRPIDIFDFAFHGLPWVLLAIKLSRISRHGAG
ncbi:RND transporter [Celeribacter sp.]|uniref:RND transporter n=1 Tax=Celeribacter sp. TaxID=1890673 RepID=UPI003A928D9C